MVWMTTVAVLLVSLVFAPILAQPPGIHTSVLKSVLAGVHAVQNTTATLVAQAVLTGLQSGKVRNVAVPMPTT